MVIFSQNGVVQKVVANAMTSAHSAFYRDKYRDVAMVSQLPTLESLPFLTRGELVATPVSSRTYVPKNEVAFFGFSSGTTSGVPLVSVFGQVTNYHVEPDFGTGIVRPLIVYPPLNKNFGASFIQQCREAAHTVSPVFGDYERLANSAVLAAMTDCDSVYATPTLALALAPYLVAHYDINQIQFLAVASELLTPYLWQQLRTAYPAAKISNLYASSEIGQFILYTEPQAGDQFDDKFILMNETVGAVELVEGELVVTHVANPAFPLLRYRTGDFMEDCSCEVDDGRIRLRMTGRYGVDVVKMGGFEIRSGDVDAWIAEQPQTITSYQLHIYEEVGGQCRMVLECVMQQSDAIAASVEKILDASFRHTFMLGKNVSVADGIARGLIVGAVMVQIMTTVSTLATKRKVLVHHPLP
jgi:phenylacetate-coenzyme A ligase PaaK-like adenylate-forming protein